MSRTVVDVALAIAVQTPKRQSKATYAVKVPWRLLHELRRALVDEGYDIDAARKADFR